MTIYWTPFCPDFTPSRVCSVVCCCHTLVSLGTQSQHLLPSLTVVLLARENPGVALHAWVLQSSPCCPWKFYVNNSPHFIAVMQCKFLVQKKGKGNTLSFLHFYTAVILQSLWEQILYQLCECLSNACNSEGSSWTSWSSCPLNEKIIVVRKNKWDSPVLLKESQF